MTFYLEEEKRKKKNLYFFFFEELIILLTMLRKDRTSNLITPHTTVPPTPLCNEKESPKKKIIKIV